MILGTGASGIQTGNEAMTKKEAVLIGITFGLSVHPGSDTGKGIDVFHVGAIVSERPTDVLSLRTTAVVGGCQCSLSRGSIGRCRSQQEANRRNGEDEGGGGSKPHIYLLMAASK